ncbi:hypothetical protein CSA08_01390 [Candidatus Gracilibacteria bacterium]|nr:MAG: hypothetical protein CSA08_01390 [Candidatus Gracilibacteria bacterium]
MKKYIIPINFWGNYKNIQQYIENNTNKIIIDKISNKLIIFYKMKTFEYKKGSLILLSGIPGSGKSTFAKKYFPKSYILSTDELRERYFGDEYKFGENGDLLIGNYEHNGAFIFEILLKIAKERCNEGLTTVIDAMNLKDSDRSKFIEIGKWSKIYTVIFDSEKGIKQNKLRKEKNIKGYVNEDVMEKKIISFDKKSCIKGNNIIYADEIEKVDEVYDSLELTEDRNIIIYGDIHGMKNFYSNYKLLQEKYTKRGNPPLNLFVGDIVDRGEYSVDDLCFIISEVKKGNAEMIIGNHDFRLLKNIKNFLENGIIEDFVEARYKTIKQFVELHKKDGIYNGFIKEIKGENFNLHKVKNFLESLSYYKMLTTDTNKKYCITHAPIFVPSCFGNLKKSQCIFGAEQLTENLRVSRDKCKENNMNFVKAINKLYKQNDITCVNGHIDMQLFIDKCKTKGFFSLEGKVDSGGKMKVLILEKNDKEISETMKSFESDVNYIKGQTDAGEYTNFSNMDKKLVNKKSLGDFVLFKYTRDVFYKNLWLKNSDEDNDRLLKARGIVLDKLGNVISYPFDKIFNNGEILCDVNGEIVIDNKLKEGEYLFVEKLNGFLGIISQNFYNKNELFIHTSGSLNSKFNKYIEDCLDNKQRLNIIKFFKTKGRHTLMFEVIHPDDPHIIKYEKEDCGLYLIGARNIEENNLEDMCLLSEKELDILGKELGFKRPKHFIESYNNFKKRIKKEKIEGYIVRNIKSGKFLIKIKFPYYLITKFIARMSEKNFKFLFANKEEFIKNKSIDEEFFPIINHISDNKEIFMNLNEQEKIQKIREFLENNI